MNIHCHWVVSHLAGVKLFCQYGSRVPSSASKAYIVFFTVTTISRFLRYLGMGNRIGHINSGNDQGLGINLVIYVCLYNNPKLVGVTFDVFRMVSFGFHPVRFRSLCCISTSV